MRKRRPPVEVEILERKEHGWAARIRLKTTVVEMRADGVTPAEASNLLVALHKEGVARLKDIGEMRFGQWKLYGGVDTEWAEWVKIGAVLPDDPKMAWKFTASKYPKFFEARFFTPSLGPFALSMALRPLAREIKVVKPNPYTPPLNPGPAPSFEGYLEAWEKLKDEWGW